MHQQEVAASPTWEKRRRQARFVRSGLISLENAIPDAIPPTERHDRMFFIILRNGFYVPARLLPSDFGGFIWQYPTLPSGCAGTVGIWLPDKVVAWSEAVDLGNGRYVVP